MKDETKMVTLALSPESASLIETYMKRMEETGVMLTAASIVERIVRGSGRNLRINPLGLMSRQQLVLQMAQTNDPTRIERMLEGYEQTIY